MEVQNSQFDLEVRRYPQQPLEFHAVAPVHHPQQIE